MTQKATPVHVVKTKAFRNVHQTVLYAVKTFNMWIFKSLFCTKLKIRVVQIFFFSFFTKKVLYKQRVSELEV